LGDLVYEIGNILYVNLTNACTNDCSFCIRRFGPGLAGASLWLERDAPPSDYIRAIEAPGHYREIVFCGYGEPLIRVAAMSEIARDIRRRGGPPIRVDTNGQANLYHGRDILPDLSGLADVLSVSLNAHDNATYERLCRPIYGPRAYPAVMAFASEAVGLGFGVVLTAVGVPGVDVEACRGIARDMGAAFRLREYLDSPGRTGLRP
jgi:TatD family-associated radical SAM protein